MRALWDFVAGGSRVAPLGIALALGLTALALRLGWAAPALPWLYCGVLVATLVAAAFERT